MLDLLTTGDIVPGERIGAFVLGERWDDVQRRVPATYTLDQRHFGVVAIRFPSICFFIDQTTGIIDQITVFSDFAGRIGGAVGIGTSLAQLACHYGPWVVTDDGTLTFAPLPGVCFELEFPSDADYLLDDDEQIAYISVFRP